MSLFVAEIRSVSTAAATSPVPLSAQCGAVAVLSLVFFARLGMDVVGDCRCFLGDTLSSNMCLQTPSTNCFHSIMNKARFPTRSTMAMLMAKLDMKMPTNMQHPHATSFMVCRGRHSGEKDCTSPAPSSYGDPTGSGVVQVSAEIVARYKNGARACYALLWKRRWKRYCFGKVYGHTPKFGCFYVHSCYKIKTTISV